MTHRLSLGSSAQEMRQGKWLETGKDCWTNIFVMSGNPSVERVSKQFSMWSQESVKTIFKIFCANREILKYMPSAIPAKPTHREQVRILKQTYRAILQRAQEAGLRNMMANGHEVDYINANGLDPEVSLDAPGVLSMIESEESANVVRIYPRILPMLQRSLWEMYGRSNKPPTFDDLQTIEGKAKAIRAYVQEHAAHLRCDAQLDLSRLELTAIPSGLFDDWGSTPGELNLGHNQLVSLRGFPRWPLLIRLDLQSNRLRHGHHLPQGSRLFKLNLSDNKLKNLLSFPTLSHLGRIQLAHNELQSWQGFERFPSCIEWDLRHNPSLPPYFPMGWVDGTIRSTQCDEPLQTKIRRAFDQAGLRTSEWVELFDRSSIPRFVPVEPMCCHNKVFYPLLLLCLGIVFYVTCVLPSPHRRYR